MTSIQLNKPTVFIMLGYPGAGKTTFARQFASEIGAFHLNADRIRHELFDEANHSREENSVVDNLADYMFEEMIARGISVVYDSHFARRSARARVRDMAKKYKFETIIIWVQTDLETAFERSNSRDRRQPENKYAYELPRELFEKRKSELTKPTFEDYVVISGKHVFANQLHVVANKLAKRSKSDGRPVRRVRQVTLGGRVDPRRRSQRLVN